MTRATWPPAPTAALVEEEKAMALESMASMRAGPWDQGSGTGKVSSPEKSSGFQPILPSFHCTVKGYPPHGYSLLRSIVFLMKDHIITGMNHDFPGYTTIFGFVPGSCSPGNVMELVISSLIFQEISDMEENGEIWKKLALLMQRWSKLD